MERKVEPVKAADKVRPVYKVQPFKFEEELLYSYTFRKKRLPQKKSKVSPVTADTATANHAHPTDDGVGEKVDYKV